ncbi:MAG: hypothetical protein K8F29_07030 [Kofleriaceae bacterium]|nr:hypothetical protein [Candidatus Methylomirabilis lanthanidiphila]
MKRTSDGQILVAADTSFLVNFLALDRMDILHSGPSWWLGLALACRSTTP